MRPTEVSRDEVRPAEFCPERSALRRSAPANSARLRSAPLRSAPTRLAPLRSGRMSGFSLRQTFQASTPFLSIATCSSFAMEASLLRLGQFRLDHALSLFQGFHLSFR